MAPETLLPVFGELLVKGSAFIAITAFFSRLLRHRASAAARHILWLSCLVALIALPLTKLIPPVWTLSLARGAAAPPVQPLPMAEPTMVTSAPLTASPVQEASTYSQASTPFTASQWVLVIWALGAIALLLRKAVGVLGLRRLVSQCQPVGDRRLVALARNVAEELGVTRSVELRIADDQAVPVTWGVFRPVLLLPTRSAQWSDDALRAVFRHEYGHIRRHDYLIRLLASVAVALHWANPLVWLAHRKLCEMQEISCDDLVLTAGAEPSNYASLLIDAIRTLQHEKLAPESVAMARPSTLENRIIAICDVRRHRGPAGYATLALAVLIATVGLGASVLAQTTPPQPTIAGTMTRPAPSALTRATRMKLSQIIIPQLDLKNASLAEALQFLERISRDLDPQKQGVTFTIDAPAEWKSPPITLSMQNVPLLAGTNYVTSLINAMAIVVDRRVLVIPIPPGAQISTEDRQIPLPPILRAADGTLRGPAGRSFKDAGSLLADCGFVFTRDSNVAVTADGRFIRMNATAEQADQTEATLAVFVAEIQRERAGATPRWPVPVDERKVTQSKLDKIIISRLELREASLGDALKLLGDKARESDPERTGVPFVLRDPSNAARRPITLSVQNITLHQALKYVASLSGAQLIVEPKHIVIAAKP